MESQRQTPKTIEATLNFFATLLATEPVTSVLSSSQRVNGKPQAIRTSPHLIRIFHARLPSDSNGTRPWKW